MSRLLRAALLVGLFAVLTACGTAGTPGSGGVSDTTPAPAITDIVDMPASATSTAADADAAPVTEMMGSLRLAGERFASAGDPDAPITVVEFSDFG